MRTLLQVFISVFTAASPEILIAPQHYTPEPTIPYLIVLSAVRHHVPIDLALHRGWKESNFMNIVTRNKEGFYDVGPMQLNSHYTPDVFKMSVSEGIDAGVAYLAHWWRICGDYHCAEESYRIGHLSR